MSSPPPRTKRDVPPRLPSKKQRSQSLTPVQMPNSNALRIISDENGKYQSADGVIVSGDLPPHVRRIMQIEKCSSVDGISKRADENKEPINSNGEAKTNGNGHVNGTNSLSRSSSEMLRNSKFTTHSLPRGGAQARYIPPRTSSLSRDNSLTTCAESKSPESDESPPPKPLKERNNKDEMAPVVNRVASYHASGSDSGEHDKGKNCANFIH